MSVIRTVMKPLVKYFVFVLLVFVCSSDVQAQTTSTGDGAPINIDEIGSDHITVSWNRTGNWSNVESYNVKIDIVHPSYSLCKQEFNCSNDPCLFTYNTTECNNLILESCTTLHISVEGGGNSSTLSNITAGVGSLIDVLTLSPTNRTINASWSLEDADCPHLDGYIIKWESGNGDTEEIYKGKTDSQHLIEDLIPCSEYSVTVQPLLSNNESLGEAQKEQNSTENEEPEPPTILDTKVQAKSINVSWTQKAWGPLCPIKHFNVSWTDLDTSKMESSQVTDPSIHINNLTPCTEYRIEVKSINIEGYSNTSLEATTESLDGAPINIAEIGSDHITVSWNRTGNWLNAESYNVTIDIVHPSSSRCKKEFNCSNDPCLFTYNTTECNNLILESCTTLHISVESGCSSSTLSNITAGVGSLIDVLTLSPTNRTINASWSLEDADCPHLDGYIIKWESGNGDTEEIYKGKTDSRHLIENLIPCSEYNVTVQPLLSNNKSLLGEPKKEQNSTENEVLDPPSSFRVEERKPKNLTVSWTQTPWGSLCPPTGFKLSWMLNGTSQNLSEVSLSSSNTSYTVPDLIPCSSYKMEIFSVNSKGNSSVSATENTTEVLELKPPTNLDAKVQARSMNVSWRQESWGPLCPIQYFNVSWTNLDTSKMESSQVTDPSTTLLHINNLTPCTEYRIEVKSINMAGYSNASQEAPTESLVLEPPSSFNEVETTESNITVNWTQTAWGSLCPLSNFSISWNSANQSAENGSVSVDSTKRKHTIDDLKICTNYSIEIKSMNTEGLSNSTKITSGTKPMIPAAPGILSCDDKSQNFSVLLSWTTPEKNNCTIRYRIDYEGNVLWSLERPKNTAFTNSTNFTIKDLIPWTNYNICIAGDTGYINGLGSKNCCSISTKEAKPGEPENFTNDTAEVSATSVRLKWEKPKDLNGNLRGYELAWRAVVRSNRAKNYTADKTSAIIDDLLPETTYKFTLRAFNDVGFGEPTVITVTTEADSGGSVDSKIMPAGIVLSVLGGALPFIAIVAIVVYLKKCRGS